MISRRTLAGAGAAVVFVTLAVVSAPGPDGSHTLRTVDGGAGQTRADGGISEAAPDIPDPGGGVPTTVGAPNAGERGSRRAAVTAREASPPTPAGGTQAPSGGDATEAALVRGPLHTEGNRILDRDGRPVLLRGINRIGFDVMGKHPPITDSEVAHARDWGANVIRLPLGEAYINPACPTQYIPSYLESLDTVVHWITSRGMVALLDLHSTTRTPCGQSGRWRMADRPGSIAFWHTVADRYKTNPLVAFDLFNEPHDVTIDEWQAGGPMSDSTLIGTVSWTAAGMQELYDAVRSTGASNLITVSGADWGKSPAPILTGHGIVAASNLVYAIHAYTCSGPETAGSCTPDPRNQRARIDSGWTSVAGASPVMITEFGWPNPDQGQYNASVVGAAQSQTPAWGWIAFAWDGSTKGGFGLVSNLETYDATPAGRPVKAALSAPS